MTPTTKLHYILSRHMTNSFFFQQSFPKSSPGDSSDEGPLHGLMNEVAQGRGLTMCSGRCSTLYREIGIHGGDDGQICGRIELQVN